jgi:glycosyltransferase involved in cell wall biosynthesis
MEHLSREPLQTQSKPDFSVIFCVNRANDHLEQAIRSVLEQSYANFEFLVGANGCSDEFYEKLQALCTDPRIRLFRIRLPQLAFALNFLIEHASSDLLVRMDSDDVCEPQRFERLLTVATNSSADVIGSWAILIDENDQVIGYRRPPTDHKGIKMAMIRSCAIIHPTVAFRKRFWLESRGYLGGLVSEDFDLWLRGIARNAVFENVPEFLLRYRIHSNQVSRSRLGYAEGAAHWYREFLVRPAWYNFRGWVFASSKAIIFPILRRRLGK